MWSTYQVRWRFFTPLCASVPANPEYIRRWLEARQPKTKPPQTKSIDEIAQEVIETTAQPEPEIAPSALVFQSINGGLVIRTATIRSHIKDVAQVLSSLYMGKIAGERSFAVRVKNAIYWDPEDYWTPILNMSGQQVTKHTAEVERPVHAMTPKGPVNALKVFQTVEDAVLNFKLLVLTTPSGTPVVSEEDLKKIFQYGGVHGYGGERSYDGGRYKADVKLLDTPAIEDPPSQGVQAPPSESRREKRARRGRSGSRK